MNLSMRALPMFKDDYCRRCIMNSYQFNGVASFIDSLNGDLFNTDKMSWKSYYYLDSYEGDKICYGKMFDMIK